MAAVMFLCPTTGLHVHEWFDDDLPTEGEVYEPVTCLACQRVHLIDPKSGKVLGASEE